MKKRKLKAQLARQKALVQSLRSHLNGVQEALFRSEELRARLISDRPFLHELAPILAKVVEAGGPPYDESPSVLVKICNETRADSNYSIIEHVKDLRRLADEAIAARNRKRKPKLHIA